MLFLLLYIITIIISVSIYQVAIASETKALTKNNPLISNEKSKEIVRQHAKKRFKIERCFLLIPFYNLINAIKLWIKMYLSRDTIRKKTIPEKEEPARNTDTYNRTNDSEIKKVHRKKRRLVKTYKRTSI